MEKGKSLEGRGGEGVQLSVSCVAPVQFDLKPCLIPDCVPWESSDA